MEEKKTKFSWFKPLLKTILSLVALFIVYTRIDVHQTLLVLGSSNVPYLLIAAFFFVLSKGLSSVRLNRFFHSIGVGLSEVRNFRLYLKGMFYNLFLPGGIGGDAYKVYVLNKGYRTRLKWLISATLIDRFSGLNALVILTLILVMASSMGQIIFINSYNYIVLAFLILAYPAWFLGIRIFFKYGSPVFNATNYLSMGVQILQLICAYFILKSLGVSEGQIDYLTLFLVSSVVAVIPFTIGGVGARELVFVFAYQSFGINREVSIAFSLIFFLITAAISLTGSFIGDDFEKNNVMA